MRSDTGYLRHEPAEEDDNIWIVTPVGRLDAILAPVLEERLLGLIAHGRVRLVVDLAQVSFVASSGLKALIAARRRAQQLSGNVVLTGLTPNVAEVLEITGLDRLFAIYGGRAEAAAALGHDT